CSFIGAPSRCIFASGTSSPWTHSSLRKTNEKKTCRTLRSSHTSGLGRLVKRRRRWFVSQPLQLGVHPAATQLRHGNPQSGRFQANRLPVRQWNENRNLFAKLHR